MTKTITLLFAHGAGFCKEIWEPITSRLQESPLLQDAAFKTEVVTFDFKYHGASRDESETPEVDLTDPLSPRVYHSSNDLTAWTTVEMLQRVHDLKKKNPNRKLIRIGHSMGACALWNSEIQQPGSFDGLVLFEPVFGEIYVDSVTDFLVSITLQRESSWSSRNEAENHLRNFKNFSAWDRDSLEAYMKGGLVEDKSTGRTKLACSPLIEAALYCHKLLFCTDEQLSCVKCKVYFHYGERTKLFIPSIFEGMQDKWPHIYTLGKPIPRSSHCMVLEKPEATTLKISKSLAQLEPFQATQHL